MKASDLLIKALENANERHLSEGSSDLPVPVFPSRPRRLVGGVRTPQL